MRRLQYIPLHAPEILRPLKFARPKAKPCLARLSFFRAICAIGNGPAGPNHFAIDLSSRRLADTKQPVIFVALPACAGQPPRPRKRHQPPPRLPPAGLFPAVQKTRLVKLRRVNALKPYALPVQLQTVPVNNPRNSSPFNRLNILNPRNHECQQSQNNYCQQIIETPRPSSIRGRTATECHVRTSPGKSGARKV
jgi:hypothetical protein